MWAKARRRKGQKKPSVPSLFFALVSVRSRLLKSGCQKAKGMGGEGRKSRKIHP